MVVSYVPFKEGPRPHPVLLDHPLAGTGTREGLHLPAELQPAVLQHQRHPALLHLHLQTDQVAGHLRLDVLEGSGTRALA